MKEEQQQAVLKHNLYHVEITNLFVIQREHQVVRC